MVILRDGEGAAGACNTSTSPVAGEDIPGISTPLRSSVNGQIECAGGRRVSRRKPAVWDPADDRLLLDIVATVGERSWAAGNILNLFNAGSKSLRTLPALKRRYAQLRRESGTRDKWSEAEDMALLDLCTPYLGRRVQWKRDHISEAFASRTGVTRTNDSMRKRWEFLQKNREPRLHANDEGDAVEEAAVETEPVRPDQIDTIPVVPNCSDSTVPIEAVASEAVSSSEASVAEVTADVVSGSVPGMFPIDVPDYFVGVFRIALMNAKMSFVRRPLRKPKHAIPTALLSYGSELVKSHLAHIPEGFSRLGWLDALVYAAGYAIEKLTEQQFRDSDIAKNERAWFEEKRGLKRRLQADVREIEAELGRRKMKQPPSRDDLQRISLLRRAYRNISTANLIRIADYKLRLFRVIDNRIRLRVADKIRRDIRVRFRAEPKLSNLVDAGNKQTEEVLSVDDMLCFWRPIVGEARETDFQGNEFLREWSQSIGQQNQEVLPNYAKLRSSMTEVIRKGKAWKACGPDGIPLYYWKHLDSARDALLDIGPQFIETGKLPFRWLARGKTTLIFKKGDPHDPSCYRPITCLNTVYKIFTGVLRAVCRQHFNDLNVTPVEQRGLREGESNCLHVCMTDQVIAYDAVFRRHPLSVCWLDFRKAFDSVSHSYLKWVLFASRLPGYVVQFITRSMKYWRTSFSVSGSKKATPPVWVRNGIFQGDALSPELFVLAIAPVSYVLNVHGPSMSTSVGTVAGFAIHLNHQCYIDDIKLYGRSERDVRDMVRLVEVTACGIGIRLNRSKCAILNYLPGKESRLISLDEELGCDGLLSEREAYSYLGITQQLMQVTSGVEEVINEVLGRARIIFNSQLNWNLMTMALNTLVISRLRYLFTVGSRSWRKLEVMMHFAKQVDIALRKLMVECKVRYKSAAISRLYLDRSKGGLGLPSVVVAAQESVIEACAYVLLHPQMKAVRKFHDAIRKSGKRSIIGDGVAVLKGFGVQLELGDDVITVVDDNQRRASFADYRMLTKFLRNIMRTSRNQDYFEDWKHMPLAGKIIRDMAVDPSTSFYWLEKGATSLTVVRNVIAAQENCLLTRACPASKGSNNRACRKCGDALETADHVLSHCSTWLPTLYVERHDKVARCVYYKLCEQYGLPIVHYSNQVPACAINDNAEVRWDAIIPTAGRIRHNRPDIVVYDKVRKLILIFEFAVASASGLAKQRLLKINRYTVNSSQMDDDMNLPYPPGPNLMEELRRMYECEVKFIPVIVGTTGEFLSETKDDIKQGWNISSAVLRDVMERMSRCAVLGSHRVICNHLA